MKFVFKRTGWIPHLFYPSLRIVAVAIHVPGCMNMTLAKRERITVRKQTVTSLSTR